MQNDEQSYNEWCIINCGNILGYKKSYLEFIRSEPRGDRENKAVCPGSGGPLETQPPV